MVLSLYNDSMETPSKKIQARFYLTDSESNPVRNWIMELSEDDRKAVGVAIQKVEFGWPIGMPYSRKLESKLWEVRANLSGGKIARIIFTLIDDEMVLLHGFIKKTQKTPTNELETARKRLKDIQDEQ